ncbi:MAG: hypothetical protein RMJ55_02650 [Roseiflexaceae bacterium]|nr:hypothetical protein [Roseiflexaceae bacterium]
MIGTKRTTLYLTSLALLSVVCLAIGAWIGAVDQERLNRQRERLAARALWDQRPFRDYRLVVEDGDCTYDVVVRQGQITGSYRDSCNLRARTIETLFLVADGDGTVTPVCGMRGCVCETHIRVHADYDPALGYPRSLIIEATLRPNWRHQDFWRGVLTEYSTALCRGAHRRTISVLYVAAAP